ncbi:unnamed protein product [Parnassius mnemosyne]|uniref:PH domain-containing protein n=1 Tax=Parnassius mnemosyne TaxID=213953 RepID=A0AAV1KJC0_9NEOP
MHELLKHVLNERDLTRAGDLFAIPDSDIVDDLNEVLKQITEISSRPDYCRNDRDQALIEICVTRTTSCIKETGTLPKYCGALVSLLESCLHHNLMPVGHLRDDDPPHAKIASDIIACIVLVSFPLQSDKEISGNKEVMELFLPVAVQFLHKGNREISRHMARYLSLAAVHHAPLLKPHVQTIMDSIMSGNYPLCRILTNLYEVCPEPLEGHVTALVSLLPHAEQVEKNSLFALFEQIAVRRPETLKTCVPQLLSYLCSNTANQSDPGCMCVDLLQLMVCLSRSRASLVVEHSAAIRRAARPPHATARASALVATILAQLGHTSRERAQEALNFVVERLSGGERGEQAALLREATALCSAYPALFTDRLLAAVRATNRCVPRTVHSHVCTCACLHVHTTPRSSPTACWPPCAPPTGACRALYTATFARVHVYTCTLPRALHRPPAGRRARHQQVRAAHCTQPRLHVCMSTRAHYPALFTDRLLAAVRATNRCVPRTVHSHVCTCACLHVHTTPRSSPTACWPPCAPPTGACRALYTATFARVHVYTCTLPRALHRPPAGRRARHQQVRAAHCTQPRLHVCMSTRAHYPALFTDRLLAAVRATNRCVPRTVHSHVCTCACLHVHTTPRSSPTACWPPCAPPTGACRALYTATFARVHVYTCTLPRALHRPPAGRRARHQQVRAAHCTQPRLHVCMSTRAHYPALFTDRLLAAVRATNRCVPRTVHSHVCTCACLHVHTTPRSSPTACWPPCAPPTGACRALYTATFARVHVYTCTLPRALHRPPAGRRARHQQVRAAHCTQPRLHVCMSTRAHYPALFTDRLLAAVRATNRCVPRTVHSHVCTCACLHVHTTPRSSPTACWPPCAPPTGACRALYTATFARVHVYTCTLPRALHRPPAGRRARHQQVRAAHCTQPRLHVCMSTRAHYPALFTDRLLAAVRATNRCVPRTVHSHVCTCACLHVHTTPRSSPTACWPPCAPPTGACRALYTATFARVHVYTCTLPRALHRPPAGRRARHQQVRAAHCTQPRLHVCMSTRAHYPALFTDRLLAAVRATNRCVPRTVHSHVCTCACLHVHTTPRSSPTACWPPCAPPTGACRALYTATFARVHVYTCTLPRALHRPPAGRRARHQQVRAAHCTQPRLHVCMSTRAHYPALFTDRLLAAVRATNRCVPRTVHSHVCTCACLHVHTTPRSSPTACWPPCAPPTGACRALYTATFARVHVYTCTLPRALHRPPAGRRARHQQVRAAHCTQPRLHVCMSTRAHYPALFTDRLLAAVRATNRCVPRTVHSHVCTCACLHVHTTPRSSPTACWPPCAPPTGACRALYTATFARVHVYTCTLPRALHRPPAGRRARHQQVRAAHCTQPRLHVCMYTRAHYPALFTDRLLAAVRATNRCVPRTVHSHVCTCACIHVHTTPRSSPTACWPPCAPPTGACRALYTATFARVHVYTCTLPRALHRPPAGRRARHQQVRAAHCTQPRLHVCMYTRAHYPALFTDRLLAAVRATNRCVPRTVHSHVCTCACLHVHTTPRSSPTACWPPCAPPTGACRALYTATFARVHVYTCTLPRALHRPPAGRRARHQQVRAAHCTQPRLHVCMSTRAHYPALFTDRLLAAVRATNRCVPRTVHSHVCTCACLHVHTTPRSSPTACWPPCAPPTGACRALYTATFARVHVYTCTLPRALHRPPAGRRARHQQVRAAHCTQPRLHVCMYTRAHYPALFTDRLLAAVRATNRCVPRTVHSHVCTCACIHVHTTPRSSPTACWPPCAPPTGACRALYTATFARVHVYTCTLPRALHRPPAGRRARHQQVRAAHCTQPRLHVCMYTRAHYPALFTDRLLAAVRATNRCVPRTVHSHVCTCACIHVHTTPRSSPTACWPPCAPPTGACRALYTATFARVHVYTCTLPRALHRPPAGRRARHQQVRAAHCTQPRLHVCMYTRAHYPALFTDRLLAAVRATNRCVPRTVHSHVCTCACIHVHTTPRSSPTACWPPCAPPTGACRALYTATFARVHVYTCTLPRALHRPPAGRRARHQQVRAAHCTQPRLHVCMYTRAHYPALFTDRLLAAVRATNRCVPRTVHSHVCTCACIHVHTTPRSSPTACWPPCAPPTGACRALYTATFARVHVYTCTLPRALHRPPAGRRARHQQVRAAHCTQPRLHVCMYTRAHYPALFTDRLLAAVRATNRCVPRTVHSHVCTCACIHVHTTPRSSPTACWPPCAPPTGACRALYTATFARVRVYTCTLPRALHRPPAGRRARHQQVRAAHCTQPRLHVCVSTRAHYPALFTDRLLAAVRATNRCVPRTVHSHVCTCACIHVHTTPRSSPTACWPPCAPPTGACRALYTATFARVHVYTCTLPRALHRPPAGRRARHQQVRAAHCTQPRLHVCMYTRAHYPALFTDRLLAAVRATNRCVPRTVHSHVCTCECIHVHTTPRSSPTACWPPCAPPTGACRALYTATFARVHVYTCTLPRALHRPPAGRRARHQQVRAAHCTQPRLHVCMYTRAHYPALFTDRLLAAVRATNRCVPRTVHSHVCTCACIHVHTTPRSSPTACWPPCAPPTGACRALYTATFARVHVYTCTLPRALHRPPAGRRARHQQVRAAHCTQPRLHVCMSTRAHYPALFTDRLLAAVRATNRCVPRTVHSHVCTYACLHVHTTPRSSPTACWPPRAPPTGACRALYTATFARVHVYTCTLPRALHRPPAGRRARHQQVRAAHCTQPRLHVCMSTRAHYPALFTDRLLAAVRATNRCVPRTVHSHVCTCACLHVHTTPRSSPTACWPPCAPPTGACRALYTATFARVHVYTCTLPRALHRPPAGRRARHQQVRAAHCTQPRLHVCMYTRAHYPALFTDRLLAAVRATNRCVPRTVHSHVCTCACIHVHTTPRSSPTACWPPCAPPTGGSVGGLHKSMTRLSSSQQINLQQNANQPVVASTAKCGSGGAARRHHHHNILIGPTTATNTGPTIISGPPLQTQSISVNPLTTGKSTDALTPLTSSVSIQHSNSALGQISVITSTANTHGPISNNTPGQTSGPVTVSANPVSICGPVTVTSRRANNTSVTMINSSSNSNSNTNTNSNHRISVFEPYPMRDTVQHFCEKHLDKIKAYMDNVSLRLPPPAKCTIEERRSKKQARLQFACGRRGPHCLYARAAFSMRTRAPRVWIHLMFLALQARHAAALSSRDPTVASLKHCWDILKCENKTFLTLVTGAFPGIKEQEMLASELRAAGFFDVFELSAPATWGCFLCTRPERAVGFLAAETPVIEGQLKEKKGRWRLFRRWRTRYFTLSGAHLSCKGSSGGESIDINQIRSVKVSRGARNIPKAFEIFTGDQTLILKPKDGKNAEEWAQCLSIAVAHSQARDAPAKANSLPARGLTLKSF